MLLKVGSKLCQLKLEKKKAMLWNDARPCAIPSWAYRWHRPIVKDRRRRKWGEVMVIKFIIMCLITEIHDTNNDTDQFLSRVTENKTVRSCCPDDFLSCVITLLNLNCCFQVSPTRNIDPFQSRGLFLVAAILFMIIYDRQQESNGGKIQRNIRCTIPRKLVIDGFDSTLEHSQTLSCIWSTICRLTPARILGL